MNEKRDSGHRQALTPYLIVKGASRAIEFYGQAFGAEEILRLDGPDGRVGHAEIRIGDSHLMLADEHPDFGALMEHGDEGKPDQRSRSPREALRRQLRAVAERFSTPVGRHVTALLAASD